LADLPSCGKNWNNRLDPFAALRQFRTMKQIELSPVNTMPAILRAEREFSQLAAAVPDRTAWNDTKRV